jgi:DNA-binding NtrC family response regulator
MKVSDTVRAANFSPDKLLHGCRILVVEDEILIALSAQDMLMDAGAADVVVATRASEAAGHLSGSHPFDGAIIDLNLGNGCDSSVASIAVGHGIPVVFATGYGRVADLPADFAAVPIVSKPYTGDMLVSALWDAMRRPANVG